MSNKLNIKAMKKIIFLSVIVFCNLFGYSQQMVFNDAVGIQLPDNAQKITTVQALEHINKKFNTDKLAISHTKDDYTPYRYKVNDVLIALYLFDATYKVNSNYIVNAKKGLDEMNYSNKTYVSTIKKGNHYSTVITNFKAGNIEYYHFYCVNDNNTHQINGRLEFNISDKDEATTILNNLLASIKFKD